MRKDPAPRPNRTRRARPKSSPGKPSPSRTNRDTPAQRPPKSEKTARDYELTTKRRGELSELAFVYKAASLGFHVAKPYGDSERYDFILDAGHRLWRIQVKSTTTLLCGLYRINAHRRTNNGAVPYQPGEIDFLIAHIIPENAWFILPIALIQDRTSVLLAPRRHPRGPGLFGTYREAWHLLRNP
ncbi:MAG: hypothetical protein HY233_04720 [Acidobacteriales bacterium]|nr:hypothetical protein [Candidatus Koribacter versatilis]MBI3645248.1 hypothetical protein [Terriglobales bacterium]